MAFGVLLLSINEMLDIQIIHIKRPSSSFQYIIPALQTVSGEDRRTESLSCIGYNNHNYERNQKPNRSLNRLKMGGFEFMERVMLFIGLAGAFLFSLGEGIEFVKSGKRVGGILCIAGAICFLSALFVKAFS